MIKKEMNRWEKIYYYICVLGVFLIATHVGGYTEKWIIIGASIYILLGIILNRGFNMDICFLALAGAMMIHGLIFAKVHQSEYWQIRFHFWAAVWPPLLMYLVCQQATWKKSYEQIERILLIICVGTFIYSIYMREGFVEGGRIWNEFWTHTSRYATEFSYWGVFIVGIVGYGTYCMAEKKWLRGIGIYVAIIIENIINIIVDNRMVLMVTAVSGAASIGLYLWFNRKEKKKMLYFLLGVLGGAALLGLVIACNIGGIRNTSYYHSFFIRDGGILKNVRFQMMWEAFLQIPSHWKGGGTMVAAGFTTMHNYWLQVANDTGIFPFGLWTVFNIAAFVSAIKCIINSEIAIRVKYMVLPLLCSVFSYLMMEMGGHGLSEYIIFYVMIVALIRQLEKNESE